MAPRKEIIIIDDLAPYPKYGAGCCRAADIYHALIDRGFNVTLYLQAGRATDKEVFEAGRGHSRIRYIKNIDLPQLIGNLGPHLSHIWVSRPRNVKAFKDVLLEWKRRAPSKRRLISDTEAIASLRPLSFRQNIQLAENRASCVAAAKEELTLSQGFDAIVCVSEFEANLAQEVLPEVSVNQLESIFRPVLDTSSYAEREHFFFCGAVHTNRNPNIDSINWFSKRVWPIVKEALPSAEFHLAGFIGKDVVFPEVVKREAKILGPVDELQPYYDKYRVFVAPTRVAAGVPYKVRHAMNGGIPCVITDLLASQMPHPNDVQPFVTAPDQPVEFARQCISLYSDPKKWHTVQQDAYAEIRRACSAEVFETALTKILKHS
ncbi:glycosyltransferase [Kordiimonas sp.]|uniref:glycosyltransferase n=1 Tax=Kordiimonas sp. TaxID=1970157 RepID=UPI003A932180